MFRCGERVVECGDIPSAAALAEKYEESFKIESKKRMENIKASFNN